MRKLNDFASTNVFWSARPVKKEKFSNYCELLGLLGAIIYARYRGIEAFPGPFVRVETTHFVLSIALYLCSPVVYSGKHSQNTKYPSSN